MRIKRTCALCGADYWTGNGKAKYCSDKCRKEATKQRQAKWRAENPDYQKAYREEHPDITEKFRQSHPDYERDRWREIRGSQEYTKTCVVCGRTFKTWQPRKKTCSEECRIINETALKREREKNRPPRDGHAVWIRQRYGSEEAYKEWLAEQKRLKQESEEQKKADKKASKERLRQKWEEARIRREAEKESHHRFGECVVCGKTFETYNPAQKTCSKECGKKLAHAHKHKRINKNQIVDKDITLEALYRRDSGVCYLCGKPCDWNDKNDVTVGPMYPSIDHVTPISHGGMHSWANVKLAHFECNWKKSDTLITDI